MSCINLNEDITFTIPAGDSPPLIEKYGSSLRWLLDIAAGAVTDESRAIERLRRVLARLAARRGARVDARDLKIAIAGVLEAIERDLGPMPSCPRFENTDSARNSRPHCAPTKVVANVEWGLALGAGDWMPLFQRHHATVEWLLDVAHGSTSKLSGSRQRGAITRVRAALRRLTDASALVDLVDLRCVATLVLVALERDLGPVRARPRGQLRMPTPAEVFGAGFADLFRAAGKRVGKAVAP